MKIGVPREVKDREFRVAVTPGGVKQLTNEGHTVLVEASAGEGSGFSDSDYLKAGAMIEPKSAECWAAEMVGLTERQRHGIFFDNGMNLLRNVHNGRTLKAWTDRQG